MGIFFGQLIFLFVVGKLLGNPIMSATRYLTSPAACIGYYLDFRFLLGVTGAAFLLAVWLERRRASRASFALFVLALALVDTFPRRTCVKSSAPKR